jgi:aspartyl-tRNA(Asn)/glutamyl-tRNA(Gln) amidotransferase subunit A
LTLSLWKSRIGRSENREGDGMANDLHDLSIAELGGLIAARKLSPVELVEALIQRVEQYDAQTSAFITRTFDLAGQQAVAAEADLLPGRRLT